MIKKIIIVLLILVSINSIYSTNITKEINLTYSQIPYTSVDSFLLQLSPNETLYFSDLNVTNSINGSNNTINNSYSQYLTMSYPFNHTFGVNETNYTLNINYLVNNFQMNYNSTISIYKNVFINNSLNNITTSIFYKFNIFRNISNVTTITNNSQVYDVQITNNGYNITISSNTLPKVGSVDFTITGTPLQSGTVTYCGEFLTCPTNFIFDSSGNVVLKINYNIPYGQAIGTYTRVFAIQSNNTFKQGTVIFNIISPQYVIEHYVYQDSCFLNKQTMIACVREQQNFDSKRLSDFINQIMKNDTTTCPKVNETIKYVMQGEINNDLKTLYNSCTNDLNSSKTQITELLKDLKGLRVENSKLLESKDNILSDSNLQVKNAQDKAFEVKINSEKNIKNEKQNSNDLINWWINFILWSIGISSLCAYFIYRYAKDNWW